MIRRERFPRVKGGEGQRGEACPKKRHLNSSEGFNV
jgi:hypothetical protein